MKKEPSSQQLEIDELKRQIALLENRLEHCQQSTTSEHNLRLSELIMENSNAVLFRRLASNDPKKRKMTYVSPNISRFGYQAEDLISGKVMFRDLVYFEDSPRTLKEIEEYTNQGIDTYSQFYRIVTKQKEIRWVEDRTSVYEDQFNGLRYHQGIVIDIHDKKIIEEKLKKSEAKHRRIIETAAEGFILLDSSFNIVDLNYAFESLVGFTREELLGTHPKEIASAYRLNLARQTDVTSHIYIQQEFECELTKNDGQRIPVLIHSSPFLSDQKELFGLAAFITDISSHKRALQLAAEVQRGLLPLESPSVSGLNIAGKSMPCEEVGGDYYDYLKTSDNEQEIAVTIGDITGHGVDAALLMSSARSYLRVCASQSEAPADIITSLNHHLVSDMSDSGRFMSMFYLLINRKCCTLEWVRAGHDPAFLYDPPSGSFLELKGPGIALGVNPDFVYQTQYLSGLKPGQIIVLGTDGIWEAINDKGEMFGKERLKNLICQYAQKSAEKILEIVLSTHEEYTANTIVEDDLTLLFIKVT